MHVGLDVNGGALGFDKELAGAADADRVLMDHVLVGFGVAVLVVHVPAECLEERVNELAAELGLVVLARAAGVAVALEALDKLPDDVWCRHVWSPAYPLVGLGAGTSMAQGPGGSQAWFFSVRPPCSPACPP